MIRLMATNGRGDLLFLKADPEFIKDDDNFYERRGESSCIIKVYVYVESLKCRRDGIMPAAYSATNNIHFLKNSIKVRNAIKKR